MKCNTIALDWSHMGTPRAAVHLESQKLH